MTLKRSPGDIHHFHVDHNAPCLRPQIFHNHCLGFLLGRLLYQGETGNNGNFWGKQGASCSN